MTRPLLSVVALAGMCLAAPCVWADDELSEFLQRSKLAAQKLTTDANFALTQSKTLEKKEPDQARTLLQKVLSQVKDSADLSAAERTRLTQQLEARLRQVNETLRQRRVEEETTQRADRAQPASRPAGPGPADVAKAIIDGGKGQVEFAKKQRNDRAAGFNDVIGSVNNSAVPIAGDMAFAKNWKQLSEIRRQTVGPQLTAKEIALLRTLNSTMTVDFKDASFKDVLSYLQDKTGLALIVDDGSMREAMVEYDDKVNFQAPKVTVRTILRKILADRGLGYILKEGAVQILTAQKARDTMVIRTYPISDIVVPGVYAQMFGPFISQIQMFGNAQGIINLVQTSVDPPMWAANGGPATITFLPQTMSLVVRASAEMHYSIAGSLGP